MRPRRRPRTAQRRDAGVRRISTAQVRYPGTVLPQLPADESGLDSAGMLGPARDTGMELQSRAARDHRRRARTQRRTALTLVLVIGALAVLASGWKYSSDRQAQTTLTGVGESHATPLRAGTVAADAVEAGLRALNPQAGPTPYFASYKTLKLRLPVTANDVTEVGFHQASYDYAHHMKSLLPYGDAKKAQKKRTTGRDLSEQETTADAVLTGTVLKLWRNRPGKPDTAVDVGADAGSIVFAPVNGTVVKVKKFDLYGKYPDVEIHIQPDGHPDLDVVMIHISGVTCEPGDRVVAGITPLAEIRDLDPRVGPQLKRYTRNGGTHAHLQVNDATHPAYKGLKGALKVDADGNVIAD